MRKLLVLLAPLFVACAPAAQTTTDGSASAAPQAMPAPAMGIVGDYTVTLSESDLSASAPQQMRSQLAGTWVLAFHQGNHFVVTQNGRQVIEGPYRVSGNQVSFATGESGPYACNTPATYTWRSNAGQTTFTPVGTDACPGRVLAITSRPFTRTP